MKPLLVFLLAALAQSRPASTLARFTGVCSIEAIRSAADTLPVKFKTACMSEDQPGPGYNNRWRIVLESAVDGFALEEMADYVEVRATGQGYVMRSVLWGSILVEATAPDLWREFARHEGQREVRAQNLSITREGRFTVIHISERYEDFNGRLPSGDWLYRNAQAHQSVGGSK